MQQSMEGFGLREGHDRAGGYVRGIPRWPGAAMVGASFVRLTQDIEERLGIVVECVALDDVRPADIDYGSDGRQPQVNRVLALYPVRLGQTPAIGPAQIGGRER